MRKPFTDAEDLELLRLRSRGDNWVDIGRWLGRSKWTVSERHVVLTGGARGQARSPRGSYGTTPAKGPPIYAWPEPADDEHHVKACRKLGGFTRENQWGLKPSWALR